MKRIELPLTKESIRSLKAGQKVLLSGRLYTARDMAHKRFAGLLRSGKGLPIAIKDEVLYYCGPTPPLPGRVIGSCGPTTSSRMDEFVTPLLKKGLAGMIGKGKRSKEVCRAIKEFESIYFIATGGAGALLSEKVEKANVAAFRELGTEAVYELWVKDFPVIVGIDSKGRDIYER